MLRKPSPSMVVALIALAVALSGTAYAASTIRSRDVVNNSLRSADIRNNSLTTSDIRDRSLRARDFRGGELPRGATGPAGPAGADGAAGPQGATGPAGPAGASATTLFAVVAEGGSLLRGKGAVSASRTSLGHYDVTFSRTDLSGCIALGTVGSDTAYVTPMPLSATVEQPGAVDKVHVRALNAAGSDADRPFYLAVFC